MTEEPTPEIKALVIKFAKQMRAMMDEGKIEPHIQVGACVATAIRILADYETCSAGQAMDILISNLLTAKFERMEAEAKRKSSPPNQQN